MNSLSYVMDDRIDYRGRPLLTMLLEYRVAESLVTESAELRSHQSRSLSVHSNA